jgi:cyclohexanone monooxygenase
MAHNVKEVDALVIGGGFRGIRLLHLLHTKLHLENEVVSAHYDAGSNRWEIATDQGFHFSAIYFLTALGILTNPYIQKFSGIDSFQGLSFHSARWPKGLDVTGKRVAVIGTGPLGSQITGTIHPIVKQITVFQQHARYIVPVNDRPVSEEEKREIYQNYDGIWFTVFNSLFAMGFVESKKSALEASETERDEVYEWVWNKGGGFRFFFETFNDLGDERRCERDRCGFCKRQDRGDCERPEDCGIASAEGALWRPSALYTGVLRGLQRAQCLPRQYR